jgi:hypothetical protein
MTAGPERPAVRLPYPHMRNDCTMCRERDVPPGEPVTVEYVMLPPGRDSW